MRLGIISDAHGHVEAFKLALDILEQRGAERFYFLGDAVGYLPGTGVVELIMTRGLDAIAGNHEIMLIDKSTPPELEPVYRLKQTAAKMTAKHLDFVRALPRSRRMRAGCGELRFVHGSPADESFGYVYPEDDLTRFDVPAGTTIFMGHTHRPFARQSAGITFVNVGSCGLPRDCGHLGAACLFDDESGEAEILRFEISAATAQALRRCEVHDSVRELWRRKPQGPLIGTIVDG